MRTRALGLGGLLGALLFTFAGPAYGASKNVEFVDNLPEAKNATAINFLDYKREGDVMLVTGHFGLKIVLATEPRQSRPAGRGHGRGPAPGGRPTGRLQSVRGAQVDVLAERGHGRGPQAQARPAVARSSRVRGVDLARAGRAGPKRRDQHRGRLRDRRQGSAEAPAAELPAAADRTHDHVRQRLQVAVDRRSGEHGPRNGTRAAGPRAADHRDRPEQPEASRARSRWRRWTCSGATA